jgi:hypothetical protein
MRGDDSMPIVKEKRITVDEAIIKALYEKFEGCGDHVIGGKFGLIELTDIVSRYRTKWTTDGTVSRRLREFNESLCKHGWVLKWEVVSSGVYRIVKFHKVQIVGEEPEPVTQTVVETPQTGTLF